MSEIRPARIFSDEPILEPNGDNFFYFQEYANTISDIIAYKENRTPLTIGIYGSWGTGKTSLMRLIKHNLERKPKYDGKNEFRKCKAVWFQAWRYADEDKILAALIEEIFRTMEGDNLLENIKAQLEKTTKSLSPRGILSELSCFMSGGNVDITKFFADLEYKKMLSFVDTFDRFFLDLVYCYVMGVKTHKGATMDDGKGALAIFIDDLDRCPKERILKVLEAIKLFLDKKGCVFVIGADNDIIRDALEASYPSGADRFMEKIVQLSFTLPKMDDSSGKAFLSHLNTDETLAEIVSLLTSSLDHNPRRIKRLINAYNFMLSLAQNRYAEAENPIQPGPLMRWLVVLHVYHDFAKLVRQSWAYVGIVQQKIGELDAKLDTAEREQWLVEAKLAEMNTAGLEKFLKNGKFVSLIRGFLNKKEEVEPYTSFTASVVVVEEKKDKSEDDVAEFDKFTRPIPSGVFKLAETGKETKIAKEYELGLYLVTNSQYKRFIDAAGYLKSEWWSKEGWQWREREEATRPCFWTEDKWNQADCPVVGVCFYEAEAYCNWLTKAGKDGYQYRLPTEAEWEKAAAGDDVRQYPWGNEFDPEKCNTAESGIGGTTPVEKYPQGLSPFGCYDLAGNVWEWTDSWYDKDKNSKVLRGGSWIYTHEDARGTCQAY